jgi:hypothetical protein
MKIARLMAPTCYEESSLSVHGGDDVRFACFWQRPWLFLSVKIAQVGLLPQLYGRS